MEDGELMRTLLRGAVAGGVATLPMTMVIGFGRAAGLLYTPPPVEITDNVAERAGIDPDQESASFQTGWLGAHLAYGAACGAIFAAARPVLPRSDVLAGLLFGGAVWCVSYLGILPALELFPSAKDDAPQRQQVMIAAHAVYGISTALLARELRRSDG